MIKLKLKIAKENLRWIRNIFKPNKSRSINESEWEVSSAKDFKELLNKKP